MSVERKQIREFYPYIVLGGAFLALLFWNAFYLENWLDSDMAAEMIFSKLLAGEGKLFATTDWYYSTEFRFLYTHLVMGPLFRICESWHVIRMITNVIFYVLLLASYFYMMAELPVGRNKKILGGAVLLLPFSETLMLHMHMGNTYMSHVIILFFYLGLFLRLAKEGRRSVSRLSAALAYAALSLICGVSGVRYMLALQCPLLLSSLWYLAGSGEFQALRSGVSREKIRAVFSEERLRFLAVAAAGLFGCLAGYGINVLYVSRVYRFQTYESTNFIDVYQGIFLERAQDAFGSLLMLFGYIPGKSVLSLRGVISMMAFLLLFLLGYAALRVRREQNKLKRYLILLFYSSFLLNTFVFVFTDSTLVPRYYITTVILLIPIVLFYLDGEEKPLDRYLVAALLAVCLLTATAKTGLSMMTSDKNADRRAVAQQLQERGYRFGYATYWNANIVQELSNGAVEVANLHMGEDNSLSLFRWSSAQRYYGENYAQGRVFLLLTEEEESALKGSGLLEAGEEEFRAGGYVVYDYADSAAFLKSGVRSGV